MARKTWAISILAILSVLLLLFRLLIFAFRINTDDFASCTTPACTASQLLQRMDQSVNPCDNFYQFACGGFLNSFFDKYNIETKRYSERPRKFHKILEQDSSVNEPEYLKLAKNFYNQCLLINTKTYQQLENSIKPIESWPVLKWIHSNESEFKFNKIIFKAEWINYFFLFVLNVHDYSSIKIHPVSHGLTGDQLKQGLNNSDVKNYYDKMTNLAASFYTDASSNSTIVKMIKDILKFETDIFNMTLLPENERSNGPTEYVKMTLDELKNNYSFFDWEGYINYLRGTPINATATTIIIENIEFFKNLKYLLNLTEKIIQTNYITWKHYQRKFNIFNQIYVNNCITLTIKRFPIAMGAIYYQNYVDNSIKDDVAQIISDIKNQYSDMIINSYWIDDMTKKKAIEKLESLKSFFECPKEFLNNSIIDEFYGRLKFSDSDNYIDQSIQLDVFATKYLLTHKNESFWVVWVLFMLEYNAYYDRTDNIIALPPVYQNVLFKKNNPNFINYGLLGSIIGHEIGHAFDNAGIYYDANGIRNNWWRNDSLQNFNDRAMCMVEQYGNYTMPEINANVNGILTLGENIADNSGLKAAYHAYIKKLNSSSEGERLPGLDYNSKQLFWISYANKWCEKVTIEDSKSVLLDSHAPPEFRVIGPLSNMKEFSIDFQCPIGSKMNPMKKCTVW